MIGSKVVNNENLTKRVSDAGHEIANHTWDHPNLTNLSVSEIQHQVNMTNQAIEKLVARNLAIYALHTELQMQLFSNPQD